MLFAFCYILEVTKGKILVIERDDRSLSGSRISQLLIVIGFDHVQFERGRHIEAVHPQLLGQTWRQMLIQMQLRWHPSPARAYGFRNGSLHSQRLSRLYGRDS